MRLRRWRQTGLFSLALLTFVFAFGLIYVNQSQFEGELQTYFDRTRGAYDNQLVTRSHEYLLDAMLHLDQLERDPSQKEDFLKQLDLSYAYLNIGRYRDLYPCTNQALDAILDLRFMVEQNQIPVSKSLQPWYTILSCQNQIDNLLNDKKVQLAGQMLVQSQDSRLWTNVIIIVSYLTSLLIGWLYERQRHNVIRTLKDKVTWQRKAQNDHLTGIGNRMGLEEKVKSILRGWPSSKRDVSIFFYDLDHFKAYNDDFGHVAGDEALKAVSQAVQEIIEGCGLQYRYGGEEFVVIFDGLPISQAKKLANQARQAIEKLGIIHPASATGYLTISLGFYPLSKRRYEADELLDLADQLLYQAKVSGRNKAIFYSHENELLDSAEHL